MVVLPEKLARDDTRVLVNFMIEWRILNGTLPTSSGQEVSTLANSLTPSREKTLKIETVEIDRPGIMNNMSPAPPPPGSVRYPARENGASSSLNSSERPLIDPFPTMYETLLNRCLNWIVCGGMVRRLTYFTL